MSLDLQLFFALNGLAGRTPLSDQMIVFFGSYLPYLFVIALVFQIFVSSIALREKWRIFFVVFGAAAISRLGVVELIRFWYHRPRPFTALSSVHQLLENGEWSFPSGHAAFFFALATAAYLYNKQWGIGFFIAALFISLARVAAGVHYPSDILAGAALGVFSAYSAFRITKRFSNYFSLSN